jgi:putative tryptophan/tyrosine transport system substrate-binding protein
MIQPVRRREFITLLGGAAAAWPLAATAQQGGMRRIGVLIPGAEDDPVMQAQVMALRQGLGRLGWSESRNLRIDFRWAGGDADQFPVLAKQLVALQPDLILANSGPVALALQLETRTIPVVFYAVSDPIGMGLVASLPRPGGNITGLLLMEASITGKWLQMLKEIAPSLKRVALIGNPRTMPFDYYMQAAETLAPVLALESVPLRVETAADFERAIESFARVPNGGLVSPPDTTSTVHRNLIVALAARYRLPAVYANRTFVTAGGLMAYTTDREDMYRQAATYIDRILRGDKPADLPVQAPVKYETVLNLKTAKALGLTVPDLMIVRADEVIE